jgi:sugar phosphate isomerase/epimerase
VIELGIRAHDIGKFSPLELAQKAKEYGFQGVQLVFPKALDLDDPFTKLDLIKEAFTDPKIMMLGAYFNMVHPDPKVIEDGLANFKRHLDIAPKLGVSYVGTETGSLMGSPWGYLKENHDEATFFKAVKIVEELVVHAKKAGSVVAIEGAFNHVVYQPKLIRRLLDIINSNQLKVTVDLFNYLNLDNYQNRMEILQECLDLFPSDIVIYHLKDFIVTDQGLKQVGLGQGLMDYPRIIKTIKQVTPDAFLIFEGVTGEDISSSFELINSLL